ncbi:MAG: hypothetical protein J6A04_05990 [Clostridia bacterium]|nr:hypothetical protein [Clostridia bacterium]
MKKTLSLLILLVVLLFLLAGCTSSMSYTYKVTTGDTIKVKLNTSDGYSITSELPFKVIKDNTTLTQGTFITLEGYEQYITAVNKDSNSKIIDRGTKNGVDYIFYSYNNSEFNYIVKIVDSKTGILLGNSVSEQSAKECFERLTFSKE